MDLFFRNIVSLNHSYLNRYGEVTGNSNFQEITVSTIETNFVSPYIVEDEIIHLLKYGYVGKMWVIETVSTGKITIGSHPSVEISSNKAFPDELNDILDQVAGTDPQVLIETTAYKINVPLSHLKFIHVDPDVQMISNGFNELLIEKTIGDDLSAELNALYDVDDIEVKVDLTLQGLGSSTAIRSAYFTCVRGTPSEGNPFTAGILCGYRSYVETPGSNLFYQISSMFNNCVIINQETLIGSTKSEYEFSGKVHSIEWTPSEHYDATSRRINVVIIQGEPTTANLLDYIRDGYSYDPTMKAIYLSNGLQNGSKWTNPTAYSR